MPNPRQGETEQEFMDRCMGDSEALRDFPQDDQRAAFCHSQFGEQNMKTCKQHASLNLIRHEQHEGADHIVLPVVMIVEGVLNDGLLSVNEFGKYPQSWDGRPVPVMHPEEHGAPVSANRPDIHERRVGTVYNTHVDGDKLKAELWINKAKCVQCLLTQIESGEVLEVSTGYFCDAEYAPGEHKGQCYSTIHRNIRPDHLALLPGETGACSVADGCGTPRVNKMEQPFFERLATAVANKIVGQPTSNAGSCSCAGDHSSEDEEGNMPQVNAAQLAEKLQGARSKMDEATAKKADVVINKLQKHEELKTNEQLTPDQLELLQGIAEDEQQLRMALAFLEAAQSAPEPEPEPDMMDEMPERMQAMVDKAVQSRLSRERVTAQLETNSACPFTRQEMNDMPVEHLQKLEQSIRPADYSGQGGLATNNAGGSDPEPLGIPSGVMTKQEG